MTKLEPGDQAPEFEGVDQDGNTINNASIKGKKTIIYFYPKDNTPGCTKEACNLRDHYKSLQDKGYQIVGVSADSEKSHHKFIKKYDLPFPLISDQDYSVIKAFDAWGTKKFMGKEFEGVLRMTFVIDEDGKISSVFNKVKTKEHTEQILKEEENKQNVN